MHTVFSALGDATRFAIVERLLTEGDLTAGDLTVGTGMSAPAISRHLKVLRKAGVLAQRSDAQRRIYSVDPAAVQTIHRWTMDHREFWEASMDRLEAAVREEKNV
ncbi:MAG: metalloregulator ArsR/SmtB family transcription factor [Pseudomonadota bacterium]